MGIAFLRGRRFVHHEALAVRALEKWLHLNYGVRNDLRCPEKVDTMNMHSTCTQSTKPPTLAP